MSPMKIQAPGPAMGGGQDGYRRGFSLIEVLIAVLVLAIGLLGLGAVFPAIIAEQRGSFEVIEGENVAGAAASLLTSGELVDFSLLSRDFNRPLRGGPVSINPPHYSYEWVVSPDGMSYYSWSSPTPGFNFDSGLWSFNFNDSGVNPTISIVKTNPELGQIPVAARLYPQPYSGKDPKYVWDLALRREPGGDRAQAAIFVRRVDARIRVPKGYSLSDVLTGTNGPPQGTMLPVALNATTGLPVADTGQPEQVYAAIQTLPVEVYKAHLDWLVFPTGRDPSVDTSVGFATQPGQKLLDNTGVVRTVVGAPRIEAGDPLYSSLGNNARVILVDPPFTSQNAGEDQTDRARSTATANLGKAEWDDERASWVRQVIFTPRTPVAIRVVTLEDAQ